MGTQKIVLVDTDIFIKVFRGDEKHKKHLDALAGRIAVSVVSYLELYQGASSKRRKYDLEKQFRAYQVLHLNEKISLEALSLAKKYLPEQKLLPPDCLIAATALHYQVDLYTDNHRDFEFVEGLKLYTPNNRN
jgi:tRNA(fMet)-specific endonuclease VapC